ASGAALPSPGPWEAIAELPADHGGRHVEGWAEFGLVAHDGATEAADRLYLVSGRVRLETAPGSRVSTKEFNTAPPRYEPATSPAGPGTWHIKTDTGVLTPRRFPAVGWVNGAIYMAGGRGTAAALDTMEMYRPDPVSSNPALGVAS